MRTLRVALAAACLTGALLGGAVLAQKLPTADQLGGKDRFLTSISTDKPIYKTGETVWARGVVLSAADHTPLPANVQARARLELKGPKGETVVSTTTGVQDGVWSFTWPVPEGTAGGEYTLKVSYPFEGHAPAQRRFDVRVYRAPRLKSQIVFLRDGYGPGDKVTATLDVKRAEGGVPAGAKVTATARVDGTQVAAVQGSVDAVGRCTVSFELPKAIERGEGSLAFAVEDGGVVETATKTLPILLQTLDLSLYPEGGDLAAGVANRVYFQARTPAQKPADVSGVIVRLPKGEPVASFKSEHEGRGRFSFTPEKGVRYELRVESPSGIRTTWPLPEARAALSLRTEEDVASGGVVRMALYAARDQAVRVTLSSRERELSAARLSLKGGGQAALALEAGGADGVLTATVWSEQGEPLAERLVFRRPQKALTVELVPDKQAYVPGGEVGLTVRTRRDGKPVSAVVGLSVTDDAVLEMVEKREQAPRLPVMVLLEPEVKDLADAHVYLDEKNPKAALSTDLLLGTQGWRRFALVDVQKFLAAHGEAGARALAFRAPAAVHAVAVAEGGVLGGAMPKSAVATGAPMPRPARPGAPPPPAPAPGPKADPAPAPKPAPAASQAVARAPEPIVAADRIMAREAPAKEEKARRRARFDMDEEMDDLRFHQPVTAYAREYAHQVRPGRQPTDRVDFAETLFWHAGLRTDAKTGEARVRFAMSDSVTTFRAFADAFSSDGSLGVASAALESVQPFYVEAKLPLEVTGGDVIQLPVAMVNGTEQPLPGGTLSIKGAGDLRIGAAKAGDLAAKERARRLVDLTVGVQTKPVELTFTGKAGPYTDNVTRTLSIRPKGFPYTVAFGGVLEKGGVARQTVTIPEQVVPASVQTKIAVFPTPLANMTEALARLIQEPSGCFEQTSSTTYPLTMAQQYFLSHQGVDPKFVEAAKDKLERGYKRLVGFECKQKGFEWFGEDPGHEALTAYGIMQFTDMAQVREVDATMLANSKAWLLKQRDGKGGFERKRRALHTWIEDRDCSNGYILWALLESGEKGLEKEVAAFKAAAPQSPNSYVWALGANVQSLAGDRAAAKSLLEKLAAKQQPDGSLGSATTTIIGSGGEALTIEATALATLAWLRDPAYAGQVEKSIKYLADSCKGGRYGSTQSTVLALRAIVAYDKARAKPKGPGSVRVYVDGQPVGSAVAFDDKTQGAILLPDVSELLGKGSHAVELRMNNGSAMPYTMEVRYHAITPDSAKDCKVGLEVKLAQEQVVEGQVVEAYATVTNRAQELVPTTVAIVGLPGGLEPRHDQLKELVKKGTIDAYEVLGREVVLYWRGMTPGSKVEVPLSLVAGVPGRYTGPASRAYLYYTDELKTWTGGLKATITPKG